MKEAAPALPRTKSLDKSQTPDNVKTLVLVPNFLERGET